MNKSTGIKRKTPFGPDMMDQKRQKKALREFKEVLHNMVFMLRKASGGQTAYLYWINRERRQFVLETKATTKTDVVFQDRVPFDDHFLSEYKNIHHPQELVVGGDIDAGAINHHSGNPSGEHLTLLPFYNNDETVAITVVESAGKPAGDAIIPVFDAYMTALGNVLNTYLELSDLYENQQEWIDYEESLHFLKDKGHFAGLIKTMLDTMQALLVEGGVSLVSTAGRQWVNLMNAEEADYLIPVGLAVEDRSLARKAMNSKAPEFAIHFNQHPKKISPRELRTEGATLAIPMMFDGFCRAAVLVYDENPLVFSESTKHKLQNIVHLTGLKVQTKLGKSVKSGPLLANEYGAIIPDCWERVINTEIKRLKENKSSYDSWVGLVTPGNLSQLRTQFRLEDMHGLQSDLVHLLNPNAAGISGFIGMHTDYVYLVFLQSNVPQAGRQWQEKMNQTFAEPVILSNGKRFKIDCSTSFIKVNAQSVDSYQVISKLKKRL